MDRPRAQPPQARPPQGPQPPGRPLTAGLRKGHSSGIASMVVVLLVALGIWLLNGRDPGSSTGTPDPSASPSSAAAGYDPASLPTVALTSLPQEAQDTVRLIDRGGPYPYSQDGATFGNYEGLLPTQEHGYYQEFTVPTPGSSDRGARRIIVGQGRELYWTADHYATFQRILR